MIERFQDRFGTILSIVFMINKIKQNPFKRLPDQCPLSIFAILPNRVIAGTLLIFFLKKAELRNYGFLRTIPQIST